MVRVMADGFLKGVKTGTESQRAQLMVPREMRGGLLTVGNDYADGLRLREWGHWNV